MKDAVATFAGFDVERSECPGRYTTWPPACEDVGTLPSFVVQPRASRQSKPSGSCSCGVSAITVVVGLVGVRSEFDRRRSLLLGSPKIRPGLLFQVLGRRPNSNQAKICVLGFSAIRVWLVSRFYISGSGDSIGPRRVLGRPVIIVVKRTLAKTKKKAKHFTNRFSKQTKSR